MPCNSPLCRLRKRRMKWLPAKWDRLETLKMEVHWLHVQWPQSTLLKEGLLAQHITPLLPSVPFATTSKSSSGIFEAELYSSRLSIRETHLLGRALAGHNEGASVCGGHDTAADHLVERLLRLGGARRPDGLCSRALRFHNAHQQLQRSHPPARAPMALFQYWNVRPSTLGSPFQKLASVQRPRAPNRQYPPALAAHLDAQHKHTNTVSQY